MMWFNIDVIIVFLFLVANFIVGIGIRRKIPINDFKTYSLGSFKDPSIFFLTASFTSCFITGAFFILLLQQAYHTGISYILKNIFLEPLSYVLTAFLVLPLHRNRGLTLNEWMDEKFHSSFLRALMGLAEFLFFLGLLVLQFKTFGTIAKALFDLPQQYENLCVIGFAIFLCLYMLKGGFVSIVYTDILQFCVFIIAFVSLVVYVTFKTDFFAGVWERGVIDNPRMSLAPCFKDYNTILFTLCIWGQTIWPRFNGSRYQRIMMCNNAKKVKKSILYAAGIVALFTISSAYMSLLVYSKNPNLTVPEIVPFFINNYCPIGLKGLLCAGLLAMGISSTESDLNSNSVVFVNDIIPFFCKIFSKKTYTPSIFTTRIVTVFFCFVCVYISLIMNDLLSIFMLFCNFYFPIEIAPSLILALGFNVKKASIMSGVFCGILATFLNYLFTGSLSSYFLGLMANLTGILLMELFFRMKKKNDNSHIVAQTE